MELKVRPPMGGNEYTIGVQGPYFDKGERFVELIVEGLTYKVPFDNEAPMWLCLIDLMLDDLELIEPGTEPTEQESKALIATKEYCLKTLLLGEGVYTQDDVMQLADDFYQGYLATLTGTIES